MNLKEKLRLRGKGKLMTCYANKHYDYIPILEMFQCNNTLDTNLIYLICSHISFRKSLRISDQYLKCLRFRIPALNTSIQTLLNQFLPYKKSVRLSKAILLLFNSHRFTVYPNFSNLDVFIGSPIQSNTC